MSGRYHLESLLGAGAFATVYFASDSKTYDREVAIKVLHPEHTQNPDYVERFHQEVRVASRIATRHREHLVQIIDQGVCEAHSPALVYFVMEYIDGVSLRSLVADMRSGVRVQRHLAWQRAVSLAQQLCRAIAPLHANGVIHRDIKPENCLIERRNDREVIKLLDLGIAKVVTDMWPAGDVPTTDARMVLGTPRYMAPEQMLGLNVDRRADIYAVGVILYEFLTGKMPRRLLMTELEAGKEPPEPLPPSQVVPEAGIPTVLDAAVLQAIAWAREERFMRAEALAAALEDASRSMPARVRGITSRITQPFLPPVSTRRVQAPRPAPEALITALPEALEVSSQVVAIEEEGPPSGSRWVWASRRFGGVMLGASTVSGLVFVLAMMLAIQPRAVRATARPKLHDLTDEAAPKALEPPEQAPKLEAPPPEFAPTSEASMKTPVRRTAAGLVKRKLGDLRRECGAQEPRLVEYYVRFAGGTMAVAEAKLVGAWSGPNFPEFQACVTDRLREIDFSRASDRPPELRGLLNL